MKASITALTAVICSWTLGGCAMMSAESSVAPVVSSPAVKSTIAVGPGPILLAINDQGTQLYAAANNGLHVIDTDSEKIVASLDTLPNAAGLALFDPGKRAYLTNLFSLQLAVIDTGAESLLTSIQLLSQGTRPAYGRVAVSKDGAQVYVIDRAGQNLMVVDTVQGSSQAFQLDLQPNDVTLSPDGRWAHICGCKSFCTPGTVQRFDTQQGRFADEFKVGPSPYRIVFAPSGKTIYTANLGDGSISVVDAASLALTANVQVSAQLTALAISNDSRWIFAVSRATNQLAAVDATTNEVRNKMTIGPAPREVVLSPDGRLAYVSTQQSVVVVDTAMLIQGS